MKTLTRTTTYPFQPGDVFQCLDNLGVTGMHMTQSSMMMMGSKLDLKFLPGSIQAWEQSIDGQER